MVFILSFFFLGRNRTRPAKLNKPNYQIGRLRNLTVIRNPYSAYKYPEFQNVSLKCPCHECIEYNILVFNNSISSIC